MKWDEKDELNEPNKLIRSFSWLFKFIQTDEARILNIRSYSLDFFIIFAP